MALLTSLQTAAPLRYTLCLRKKGPQRYRL